MWGGLSRVMYIPGCAGCGSVESGHELSAMCECRYSTGRVQESWWEGLKSSCRRVRGGQALARK